MKDLGICEVTSEKREGFNKGNNSARSAQKGRLTLHPSPLTNGAGQRASLFGWMAHGHVAFTMAEILLSLTIIGVVAAITLPSLTGNINERTWNTQRKALYARFSQAIALMPALNSYGTWAGDDDNKMAETFISSGLAKVLKINNICSFDKIGDCGVPDKLNTLVGSPITPFPKRLSELNNSIVTVSIPSGASYSQLDTKAAAFETANGESIVVYYNPKCKAEMVKISGNWDPAQARICANFIYDLNGKKGPNTIGKDMGFISVFYPTDSSVVAPMPYTTDSTSEDITFYDSTKNATQYCTEIADGEYRLPNKNEVAALFINRALIGNLTSGGHYWSTELENGKGITGSIYSGAKILKDRNTENAKVRCVKR